jgi:hypothetical protein
MSPTIVDFVAAHNFVIIRPFTAVVDNFKIKEELTKSMRQVAWANEVLRMSRLVVKGLNRKPTTSELKYL